MKKIFLIAISLISLASCSEYSPSGSEFIIDDVTSMNNINMYRYHLSSTSGLVNFYMKDSANKYTLRDTVKFNLK